MANPIMKWALEHAGGLRFPYLFLITAVLFLLDLFVPDAVPFADELLLGLLTVTFGAWRKRKQLAQQQDDGTD